MGRKGAAGGDEVQSSAPSVRITISFPPDVYQTLDEIAREKKVSRAWVVREAAEQYIDNKWPFVQTQYRKSRMRKGALLKLVSPRKKVAGWDCRL